MAAIVAGRYTTAAVSLGVGDRSLRGAGEFFPAARTSSSRATRGRGGTFGTVNDGRLDAVQEQSTTAGAAKPRVLASSATAAFGPATDATKDPTTAELNRTG
jgi:hypothetical protein